MATMIGNASEQTGELIKKLQAAMEGVKYQRSLPLSWLPDSINDLAVTFIEMLESTGDDSFFAWNIFDVILQQKEGYSDYRWEKIAGQVLKSTSTCDNH